MAGANLYTYPNPNFSNPALNALGSYYSSQTGQPTTDMISRALRYSIFDAAPQQFYDLAVLNMQASKQWPSDEIYWSEAPYARDPFIAQAAVTGGGNSITVTVQPSQIGVVSVNTMVLFPNNTPGIVTGINPALNTITIATQTGTTCPSVNIGDVFCNLSSVEGDGVSYVSQQFRQETIERVNYIQMFVKSVTFGRMERYKWSNSGTTNYLDFNQNAMMMQHRIDLSNCYWNGTLGNVVLSDGTPAKTMAGIFPMMQSAGSMNVSTSFANAGPALEALALNTEYGNYGEYRFLYCTPTVWRQISKYYRDPDQRYYVEDREVPLTFDMIDLSSTKIVHVPMKRFEDSASFPSIWANRAILLDQKNIIPAYALPEEVIYTLDRSSGANLNTFSSLIISSSFSTEFNNPLGSGWIDFH